jgi:uncharacterized protein (TIGR03643 family)
VGRLRKTLPSVFKENGDKVYRRCKRDTEKYASAPLVLIYPAMKKELTNVDVEQIILMAWADTIPFEVIRREYGLTEGAVIKLMRANQSPKTFTRWRQRVRGRGGKHEAIAPTTSTRQKY